MMCLFINKDGDMETLTFTEASYLWLFKYCILTSFVGE